MSVLRSRWYHRPTLHSARPGHERKVGWLELFYDLIYVATIIQLGNMLAGSAAAPLGIGRAVAFVGLFVPIWLTWTAFTFYSNRFIVDDFLHRMMVFTQMFAIGGVAISVHKVFEGDTMVFSLNYGLARVMVTAMYYRSWKQVDGAAGMSKNYTLGFGVGAALWLFSALLPEPWVYLVWAVALLIDWFVPINRHGRSLVARHPPDYLHFTERYGLLTIIVLGEAFVKVLTLLSFEDPTVATALQSLAALTITCRRRRSPRTSGCTCTCRG